MSRDRWLTAWALGSVALGGASLLVPLYFVHVDGSAVLLGVLAGVAAAAGAPGAIVVGRLADRTGKRREYFVGALLLVAGVLAVLPFTTDARVIVAANAVVWFAAGGIQPVLTLLVTVDHAESRWSERFAVLDAYGGWGWAGGLVLGTVWTGVAGAVVGAAAAQRSLLVAFAGLAVLAAATGASRLPADPASLDAERVDRVARAVRSARRIPVRSATFAVSPGRLYWLTRSVHPREFVRTFSPSLSLYFAAVLAVFVGFGAFWGPLPLFLDESGFAASGVFGLYLVASLGSALSYRRAGRLVADGDPAVLQSVGLAVRAVCQPGVAVIGLLAGASLFGVLGTVAAFGLMGLAWALVAVTATTLVTRIAPAEIRGEAIGAYVAVSGAGTGLGALIGGWLGARSFVRAFAVAGALVFVGAAFVWWLRRRDPAAMDAGDAAEAPVPEDPATESQ